MSWFDRHPLGEPEPEPTDRPLEYGDTISDKVPLWIVASGPGIGQIGTQAALNQVEGRVLLAEGTEFDPAVYPDLSRLLKPFYGERRVPPLSRPDWL
jgi:hypothetical protein